ncbi:MAG: VOC family protein, partial [Nanoarchaeota archaeon]
MVDNPIVHFEIPANDVERAKTFYEKTFGWKIDKFPMPSGDEYWGVRTTEIDPTTKMPKRPGTINGGLMKRKNANQPFMNYISVDSIDEMLKTIASNGGTVCLPKTEIAPGMGWIAAFQDTEMNLMGLHEAPESIK